MIMVNMSNTYKIMKSILYMIMKINDNKNIKNSIPNNTQYKNYHHKITTALPQCTQYKYK